MPRPPLPMWIAAPLVALISACAPMPKPRLVEAAGGPVAVRSRAGSTPVVVFQSGLGDGGSVWGPVLRALPPETATFTYDRPGYGGSPRRSGPRDPCAIARELRGALQSAGIHPPYLLVGHSQGGLHQFAFARLYPGEVAGILLLDATHPQHWATMQARTPQAAKLLKGLRAIAFSPAARQEFDDQAGCLPALPPPPGHPLPARMLIRGVPDPTESAEFQAMSRELADRWPELLPGMTLRRVEGAGHYIQRDRPEVVAREITALIDSLRH